MLTLASSLVLAQPRRFAGQGTLNHEKENEDG
jgi:hypothetical protein